MKNKHTDMPEKLESALEWIIEFMLDNSVTPTIGQLAEGIGISQGTARAYIKEMNGRDMIELNETGWCLGIGIPGVYYVDNR